MPLGFNTTLTISAADTDGLALAQTLGAAGNMTLVTSTLPNGGQRPSLTSAGNVSAVTFTFYGTSRDGTTEMTYAIAGPSGNTVIVPVTFGTVTRIAASAAVASATEAGWAAEADTQPYIVELFTDPTEIAFVLDEVSGVTMTAQHTYDDILLRDYGGALVYTPATALWFNHATAASKAADFEATYTFPVRAVRMYGSGAGSARFVGWQATNT